MSAPAVSIVIPIYRESEILSQSLSDLCGQLDEHQVDYEIILVEQFSDQRTLDVSLGAAARHARVRHILLDQPDFGRAMRTGMLEASGDIIVNFDIDYWDVTFVRMCLATMLDFGIDIVIGSKNSRLSVDNRAAIRRFISTGFRVILQTMFGLRVSDTHGIKAWLRTPVLLDLIQACKFTRDIFDTELVIRGERAGFRLLELPVTVREQRPPRSSIVARVPGAALNLARLFFVLADESRRGSVVNRRPGAISPRLEGLPPSVATDPPADRTAAG